MAENDAKEKFYFYTSSITSAMSIAVSVPNSPSSLDVVHNFI